MYNYMPVIIMTYFLISQKILHCQQRIAWFIKFLLACYNIEKRTCAQFKANSSIQSDFSQKSHHFDYSQQIITCFFYFSTGNLVNIIMRRTHSQNFSEIQLLFLIQFSRFRHLYLYFCL